MCFSYKGFTQEFLKVRVVSGQHFINYGIGFSSNFKITTDQTFQLGESLTITHARDNGINNTFTAPILGVQSIINQRMEVQMFDFDYEFYFESDLVLFKIKGGIAPRLRYFSYKTIFSSSPRFRRNGSDLMLGFIPAINFLFPIGELTHIGIGYEVRFMLNEKESLEDVYPSKTAFLFTLRYSI